MKTVLLGLLFLVLASACSIVGPGERGVRVSLGKVSTEVLDPGPHFWIPFIMGTKMIDVQIQKSEIEASAASSDMQEIKTHVAVNWSLSPSQVVKTYSTIGDESDVLNRIITPAVNEAFKASISKKTAEEVLGKRMDLKKEIDDVLTTRLSAYGVTMNDLSIVNLTFSPEFTQAIENKQIAEQKAQQAKYDAQKAVQEAQAEVNRAKGQAESQKLVKESITPAILQKLAIDKWDGKFPQYMGGSMPLPFIQVK